VGREGEGKRRRGKGEARREKKKGLAICRRVGLKKKLPTLVLLSTELFVRRGFSLPSLAPSRFCS
jgi:hypothetical protein